MDRPLRVGFRRREREMLPLNVWNTRLDGLREAIEPDVRRLVADRLGVSPEDLAPEVSLTDDLAADSLDLVELGLVLEAAWAVVIPQAALAAVRTYRDLVEAVVASLAAARGRARRAGPVSVFARTRVVPAPHAGSGWSVERAGELTPYTVEILVADVLRAGPGARLEMEVPAATDDTRLAATRDQFAWLAERGVEVDVRREHGSRRPAAY